MRRNDHSAAARVALLLASAAVLLPAHLLAEDRFPAVRAILEAKCVRCHQGEEPKGGLSLASADAVRAGGDSGPAWELGKPDESLLLEMISGDKPPMPLQADSLTAAEVAAVRAWVAAGAQWPEGLRLEPRSAETWWSLAPLARPTPPEIASAWVRTPIDAFILERLQKEGMKFSPEADRRTLIRRLTYNLHGLPPTPAEVAAFLADDEPHAYERLVERLLASPRYGERWGRHWLDVVHFGESHGYDKDKPRPHAWPYRDYVIRALNADKPYGQFVEEQLAGDVLQPNDPDGLVATGFISAGPWDFVGHVELREGTKDKEITRSNDRDDMVTTTASTFLSLTVHCARCHDHKFDPIPQADYYRMQAVFAGADRADRSYDPDPAMHAERIALAAERRTVEADRVALALERERTAQAVAADLTARIIRLEADLADSDPKAKDSPSNGYHSAIESTPDVEKWLEIDLGRDVPVEQVRLVPARPTDFPDTPGFGFPRRYKVAVRTADGPWKTVVDRTGEDQPNPGDQAVEVAFDATPTRVIRVTATRLWERTSDFVFALGELQALAGDRSVVPVAEARALDSIEAGRWAMRFASDGFDSRRRLAAAVPAARESLAAELRLRKAELEQRIDAAVGKAAAALFAELGRRLEGLQRRWQALPAPQLVYAAGSGFSPEAIVAPRQPRPIHLLLRGSVESPGPLVGPGALGCVRGVGVEFPALDSTDEAARRAALARWIADPHNPLTWRSLVNRVWHYHFDRGLVDSPNDFGRMGSSPSHPELLDWLANWFLENGQSLKALHRLIVTSAVYRQGSAENAAFAKLDGENQLLWRMNRRRLEAECVRDAALYVSGSLDLTMGGPSVQQFAFKDDHSPVYDYERFNVDSPDSRRRSVYRFLVRSVPDPLMERLDCPDPSFSTPKRNITLTAIQALATLNNKFFVRQAERLTEFAAKGAPDVRGQVALAFEAALARPPTIAELDALASYAERHGLPNACRVILNCNEFMFVD